ncbi:DoxX family protein [Daejeonia sp. YH14]|uniref:DoxX family protein n=1 Tax=Daejeonia sp. YH14 TaxID=3439042 RepID=UPI003F49865F
MGKNNYDLGILIQRLSVGGLMLFHGIHKLIGGVSWMGDMLAAKGIPSFVSYGSIIGEVIAPLMIIFGIKTRLAAFIYAFTMFVAFMLVHTGDFFSLDPATGGWKIELVAAYFLGAVVLIITGGGKFAFTKGGKLD